MSRLEDDAAVVCRWQELSFRLIVAGRQKTEVLRCRVVCRSSLSVVLPSYGGAASIAFDVHLKERGVMDKPIDRGERHGRVWEDLAPFAEGLI